jgi:poly-gamma-glutamate capsule biosynthesis protein CapA/YwtB (metallophosphatase superfamily)
MKLKSTLTAQLMLAALLLHAAPSTSAAEPAKGWKPVAGNKDDMVFALTGDSIINRRISQSYQPGTDDLYGVIRAADVGFTNFETLIHGFDLPPGEQSGGTYMGSPPYITKELEWAGFDIVGVANNHANDYGVEGIRSTVAAIAESNLVYAGFGENLALARRPAYFDTPKGRVALISTTSSFPAPIAAGPQRKDMRGRPGINPLHHKDIYTVPQATYDSLKKLRGGAVNNMGPAETKLTFGGAEYVVGDDVRINSKADPRDLADIVASVKDGGQQADWVVVSIHAHEAAGPDERAKPAEFVVEFAHAMIDAGADMVVGHGPHILRGIEIYKGKPIFYSLANFIFENDLVDMQPADNYDKTGLPDSALPSDYFTKRSKGDTVGFPADRRYWQSVVPEVIYNKDHTLKQVLVHPVSLGFGAARSKRGQPYPAPAKEADEIIKDLQEVSEPFGTTITFKNGVGTLSWK